MFRLAWNRTLLFRFLKYCVLSKIFYFKNTFFYNGSQWKPFSDTYYFSLRNLVSFRAALPGWAVLKKRSILSYKHQSIRYLSYGISFVQLLPHYYFSNYYYNYGFICSHGLWILLGSPLADYNYYYYSWYHYYYYLPALTVLQFFSSALQYILPFWFFSSTGQYIWPFRFFS